MKEAALFSHLLFSLYNCTHSIAIISQMCINVILLPCNGCCALRSPTSRTEVLTPPELGCCWLIAHSSRLRFPFWWPPTADGSCLPSGRSLCPMPGLRPNLGQLSSALPAPLGLAEASLTSLATGVILRAQPINLQPSLHVESTCPESKSQSSSLTCTICSNLLKSLVSSLWCVYFLFGFCFLGEGGCFCFVLVWFGFANSSPSRVLYINIGPTDTPTPRKHMFTTCFISACTFPLFI